MSDTTTIEWATHTFNPWEGCTKVSPGCANCYAEARNKRFSAGANWGKGKPRRRISAATWRNPVKWNRQPWICDECDTPHALPSQICMKQGCECETKHRARVFPSLCDWLDDEVPIEWLADFLKLIHDTPNLDWLLLTKRPENWRQRCIEADTYLRKQSPNGCDPVAAWLGDWRKDYVPANVWIGTSVEDQQRTDERIPELLKIPAAVRFLSVEPLLESVNLNRVCGLSLNRNPDHSMARTDGQGIDLVIVGGENGPRPCNVEWIRSIVRQCSAAGVPCFVKQLGSVPYTMDASRCPDGKLVGQWNMKHPRGGDPAEWPEDLRVRQFPNPSTLQPFNPSTLNQ